MKKLVILAGLAMSLSAMASNNESEAATAVDMQAPAVVGGCIVDKNTGEALAGVKVALANGSVTYTDFDGNFSFNNVAPGKTAISASMISYKNNILNVPVQGANTQYYKIQLEVQK